MFPSSSSPRLLGDIRSIRDKITGIRRQLEEAGIEVGRTLHQEADALREDLRVLSEMEETCCQSDLLTEQVVAQMDLYLFIRNRLSQYRLGRQLARAIGDLARKDQSGSAGDLPCPCWSGRSFGVCCGAGRPRSRG